MADNVPFVMAATVVAASVGNVPEFEITKSLLVPHITLYLP